MGNFLRNSTHETLRKVAMKVYTGTGDRGKTSLFSGERVFKSHRRIEACGEIDELNSFLGMLICMLPQGTNEIKDELVKIQSDLFQAGAWLSISESALPGQIEKINPERLDALESAIDRMDRQLPALRNFILPGGDLSGATAHVTRSVCRRAERRLVALYEENPAAGPDHQLENIMKLVNRLSDYLFVLARYLNHHKGISETLWGK